MPAVDQALDRWARIRRDVGLGLAQRLFDEVARHPITRGGRRRPVLSVGLALAYLIALLVVLLGAGFGVVGVMLLARPWAHIPQVLLGVACVALCVAARPRPDRAPDSLIDRADYPMLYTLGDRVAQAMDAAPVHGFAVSADFGANFRVAGWQRRRYIELGTPMLAILTPAERVAVLAHELSHGANGDPLRGGFLSGAAATLAMWATAVRPIAIGRAGTGLPLGPVVSLVSVPFELLLLGISELLFLGVRGFYLLVLRESQRAEYLADLLAATVAGTREMQHALQKTLLQEVVDVALHRHALTEPDQPLGSRLADAVHALTEADRDRLQDESRSRLHQVDLSHPPTVLRMAMLAAHPTYPPAGLLTAEELAALDREMDRLVASTQRELMNRQLECIYGG